MNWGNSELIMNLYKGKLPEIKTDNNVTVDSGSLKRIGLLAVAIVVVIVIAAIIIKSVPKAQ